MQDSSGESSITQESSQRLISNRAGACFLCIIYTYFRVPEPAGRSFAELDLLFERKVSARKFATTAVDVFDVEVHGDLLDQAEKKLSVAQHRDQAAVDTVPEKV